MNAIELEITQPMNNSGQVSSWKDLVGIVASIGCAIHCAAMPFVIAYLPALGLSFLADEAFHKWMALFCFLIALAAFLPGLRKHRNWWPVAVGSIGLAFITFAAFGLAGECCPSCDVATAELGVADTPCECENCESCGEEFVTATGDHEIALVEPNKTKSKGNLLTELAPWITPLGGMLLVSAHLMNRRYGCQCGCCELEAAPAESVSQN